MKKDDYAQWFSDQLLLQNRLLIGAIGAMIGLGLLTTLIEAAIFAGILYLGFIGSWILSFVIAFGLLGVIAFITYLRLPGELGDAEHEVELSGDVTIILAAPKMPAVWMYAFGSMDSDQTWAERLLSKLAMSQRLFCAAYFTCQRMSQLKTIEIYDCSSVLRLLHRKGERVEVSELANELQLPDLVTTIRNVSLIDGVSFLTHKSLGLSLTNRLVDDMAEWEKKKSNNSE